MEHPEESFYFSKTKENPRTYRSHARVEDVLINPWPLSDGLVPDMVII